MATQKQIEANRLNAQKSTGPKSDEGKARSRQNALQHGLAGAGLIVPEDEAREIEKRIGQWTDVIRPTDDRERWLAELMAIESVRIDSAQRQELVLRQVETRRAQLCWNEDRYAAALELAERLRPHPEVISARLRQTAQGCDLLIARWETLGRALRERGQWNGRERELALDLLGTPRALRHAPSRLDPAEPGEEAERQAGLAVVEAELTALRRRRAEPLDELDLLERLAVAQGVAVHAEPSRPLALVRRYLAACLRRFQWAWNQLQALRAQSATPNLDRNTDALDVVIESMTAAAPACPHSEPEPAEPNPEPGPAAPLDEAGPRMTPPDTRPPEPLPSERPSSPLPGGSSLVGAWLDSRPPGNRRQRRAKQARARHSGRG